MKLLIKRPSKTWFGILSELCVNLAAGLFIFIFIEPIISPAENMSLEDLLLLTHKLASGILLLILAKKLREDSR